MAREVAVLVAQRGEDAAVIEQSAERNLSSASFRDADVSVRFEASGEGRLVVVRVTGRAPGIVRGTASAVDVTEAITVEEFRP